MRRDAPWTDIRLATPTGDTARGAIDDGALAVADCRIARVGPRAALPGPPEAPDPVRPDGEGRAESIERRVKARNRARPAALPRTRARAGSVPAACDCR